MGSHLKSALKRAADLPKGERKLLAEAIDHWVRDVERTQKRKCKSKGKAARKRRLEAFESSRSGFRKKPTLAMAPPAGIASLVDDDAPAPRGVALDRWSAGVRDLRWDDYFPAG